MFMKERSNAIKLAAFVLFLVLGFSLYAQEKNEFKDKLKSLDGKIEKVTIKVDGKDVVFEGKDAEKLVEIVKPGDHKKMVWVSSGPGSKLMHMGGNKMKVFSMTDEDDFEFGDGNGDQKKVKVEIEDGKKKVTVTTMKEGKEETKTYEGEEAEKMLKEEGATKKFNIKIDDEDCELQDHMIMMRSHSGIGSGCGKCCCGGGHSWSVGSKHMIIKEFDGDDDKDVQVIIKKKKDKEEKKEVKK